jgi:hypothetical protein
VTQDVSTRSTGSPSILSALISWVETLELDMALLPDQSCLSASFPDACRSPAPVARIDDWEHRHGYRLPRALRAWLTRSNGLYQASPIIHPIEAIGPMVPFARVPGLFVQPESWFELGNPTESETVCIDLAYRWPGGDFPLFASGDDLSGTAPRVIAVSFDEWLIRLLTDGGRPYWLSEDFPGLGDPWTEHRRRAPSPKLTARLRKLLDRARPLVSPSGDERMIARSLGVSLADAEALVRYLQHSS